MTLNISKAMLLTIGCCAAIELVVFLACLIRVGNVWGALGYTVMIGPLSLFAAPVIYRRFSA